MQPVGDGVAPRLRLNSYLAGDASTDGIVKLSEAFREPESSFSPDRQVSAPNWRGIGAAGFCTKLPAPYWRCIGSPSVSRRIYFR